MQNQSLKPVLERLGLKQTELACILDVSTRTVSLWATGAASLPGPVSAYLRVLQAAGPDVLAAELCRLPKRKKMLDEGVYGVSYRGKDRGLADAARRSQFSGTAKLRGQTAAARYSRAVTNSIP